MGPLIIQLNRLKYVDPDSTENLIRYITRTRINEDRADELLLWGTCSGYNYQIPVEEVIYQFRYIQFKYQAKSSLMCHYVIRFWPSILNSMGNDLYKLGNYAVDCCNYIFNMGHQSCFAIHSSKDKGVHIHLAINSVNFRTGKKLRQFPKEIQKNLEIPLKNLLIPYTRHQITVDSLIDL